jgi:hypothetical protein
MPKDSGTRRAPDEQAWEIRFAPTSPTDFVLQCDGGKATLDFTDLPVRNMHLLADTTEVEVTFNRPNLVPLERFKATVRVGKAELVSFLNARARSATLQVESSKCKLDLTGDPEECESEIFVEGVPRELEVTLSKEAGFHIEAPSATLVRFDHGGLVRRDLALESADWTERKRRIKLFLFQPIPKLTVHWTD